VLESSNVIRYRDFLNSTSPSFSTQNLMLENSISWDPLVPTFSFFTQGQVFEERSIPIKAIFFYGKYLIFLEENAFLSDQHIEYLSFIDLEKYKTVLGRTGLPVFKIPIPANNPAKTIYIKNGAIEFHDKLITEKDLIPYSDINELFFNASVNMVDPQTLPIAAKKVAAFMEYTQNAAEFFFTKEGEDVAHMKQAKKLFIKHGKRLEKALKARELLGISEQYELISQHLNTQFLQEKTFQQALRSAADKYKKSNSLLNRARWVIAQLSMPRPAGLPILRNALASLAAAFSKNRKPDLKAASYLREGVYSLLRHPYMKYGFTTAAAATLAATYPEAVSHYLYQSQTFITHLFTMTFGKVSDFAYLGYETFAQTFRGLNPFFLIPYLIKNIPYLTVGITGAMAMILTPALVVHWIINFFKMLSDVYKAQNVPPPKGSPIKRFWKRVQVIKEAFFLPYLPFKDETPKEILWGQFRTLKQRFNPQPFIEQQRKLKEEFLKNLGEDLIKDQSTNPSEDLSHFTPEQTAQVQAIIESIEKRRQQSLEAHWWFKTFKNFKTLATKTGGFIQKRIQTSKQKTKNSNIDTLGDAIKHFLMSWPSLSVSQTRTAQGFWTPYFLARSFVFHPVIVMTAFLKPRFAFVAARSHDHITFPSKWNGGQRWLWQHLYLSFFKTDHFEQIKAWENKMADVEYKIHLAALKEAFRATSKFLKNHEDLKKLYARGLIENWASGDIQKISQKERFFFRHYLMNIHKAATEEFLKDFLKRNKIILDDNSLLNLSENPDFLKERSSHLIHQLEISPEEATKYVSQVSKNPIFFETSKELSEAPFAPKRFVERHFIQNLLKKLSRHNNRQIDRVFTVKEMLSRPQNAARAVRYVASGWKISYPLSLLSMVLFTAGIEDGMLELVHPDEMFGDESFLYLSRYIILSFVLSGMLNVVGGADVWMKVQYDEQHKDLFNKRLEGKEANMNMVELWLHKSFNNKDNTIWQNHKHLINRIVIPNMKAAFVTFSLYYFSTIGRFDLGGYLLSYLFSFLVPRSSFDLKMDQGFELASSSYLVSQFPPDLVHHPLAQEFINKEISRMRDLYNLGNKAYEEIAGHLEKNLSFLSTSKHGLRSLERVLFGGWTAAEVAYATLEHAKSALAPIPGSSDAIKYCEFLLTNNLDPRIFQNTGVPPWLKK
ncbi:MAG: hypothetical protein D6797_02265, partial [Bdellovibrio sp.]